MGHGNFVTEHIPYRFEEKERLGINHFGGKIVGGAGLFDGNQRQLGRKRQAKFWGGKMFFGHSPSLVSQPEHCIFTRPQSEREKKNARPCTLGPRPVEKKENGRGPKESGTGPRVWENQGDTTKMGKKQPW